MAIISCGVIGSCAPAGVGVHDHVWTIADLVAMIEQLGACTMIKKDSYWHGVIMGSTSTLWGVLLFFMLGGIPAVIIPAMVLWVILSAWSLIIYYRPSPDSKAN